MRDLSRRGFLQTTAIVAASATVPAWAQDLAAPIETLGFSGWPIVQGATDAVSARFVLLHPAHEEFACEALDLNRQPLPLDVVETWNLPGSDLATTEIQVQGLVPEVDCTLRVIRSTGEILDQRVFRSLDLAKSRCRIAAVSCMNDSLGRKTVTMWETLARQNCDLVLFVGDTCYADLFKGPASEAAYARRYAETRNTLAWFRLPRLVPSIAVWDDHDYGLNDSDKNFKFGSFTRQLFRRFWGQNQSLASKAGFGVGSVFEGFGQRFFLCDDRSFRDAPGSKLGRHWGEEQTEWVLAEFAASDRPTWLLNGSQFFGGYLGKESFEGDHRGDLEDVLSKLSSMSAPAVFLAGDVHFSEIMQIEAKKLGYPTYEFTSSSIHSLTIPFHQHRKKNPRRLASEWQHNFFVFDVDVSESWKINSRCVLNGGDTSFSRSVEIRRG